MTQKLSYKGRAECGTHYGTRKAVYCQSLREYKEMQSALNY